MRATRKVDWLVDDSIYPNHYTALEVDDQRLGNQSKILVTKTTTRRETFRSDRSAQRLLPANSDSFISFPFQRSTAMSFLFGKRKTPAGLSNFQIFCFYFAHQFSAGSRLSWALILLISMMELIRVLCKMIWNFISSKFEFFILSLLLIVFVRNCLLIEETY